mgnify:CR=1 FL=1
MVKRIIQITLFLLLLSIIFFTYLSIYGVSTNKFNSLISEKISERDKNLKISLNEIKIFLNINNLNFELYPQNFKISKEINPLNGCLDKLLGLNGVSFRWKDLPDIVGEPGKKDMGIIAQEIEKVFPEVVHESAYESPDGDKYKTVAYDKLVPVLIEAVKELSARITALESK